MSIRDYLHEKAEESRHNETLAYMMFIAGIIGFIGGVLETICIADSPHWFLFIPYQAVPHPGYVLGLALTLCGLGLMVFGIASGIWHAHDRVWYMSELRKAHSLEENSVTRKKTGKGAKKAA